MINKIDAMLGQQIVDAISQVVDKDINFIDRQGMIIASTDQTRIGSFHAAGYEVATKRKVIVVESDKVFEGTKVGVNYPIIIDDEVFGVIGITGQPSKIMKYGFLASKITEIFIKEEKMAGRYESRKKMIQYLMNMCIYEKGVNKEAIGQMIDKLHIKPHEFHQCIVIEISKKHVDFVEIETKIYKLLGEYNIELYMYNYPNHFIILISKNRMREVKHLMSKVDESEQRIIYCGIGIEATIWNIKETYDSALLALKYAKQKDVMIVESNQLDIELILESLPKVTKEKYIQTVIGNLTADELDLLNCYYECNMSLKETAEKLYIHKNTVQYRLDKIYMKIGINPREFKQSIRIYLGI
ncbi:MAG: sugar diacid recognition domain-containing protein, partial [Niameybacter sp.]